MTAWFKKADPDTPATPAEQIAIDAGYSFVRTLPDGRVIGLQQMLATVGLIVDITWSGYESRYCYPPPVIHALAGLLAWDGTGDPPGAWIKHKGAPGGDRMNPSIAGVRVVVE